MSDETIAVSGAEVDAEVQRMVERVAAVGRMPVDQVRLPDGFRESVEKALRDRKRQARELAVLEEENRANLEEKRRLLHRLDAMTEPERATWAKHFPQLAADLPVIRREVAGDDRLRAEAEAARAAAEAARLAEAEAARAMAKITAERNRRVHALTVLLEDTVTRLARIDADQSIDRHALVDLQRQDDEAAQLLAELGAVITIDRPRFDVALRVWASAKVNTSFALAKERRECVTRILEAVNHASH